MWWLKARGGQTPRSGAATSANRSGRDTRWVAAQIFPAGIRGGRLIDDATGVTAIEYALIASLISVLIIASVATMGQSLNGWFTTIGGAL